MMTTVYLNGSLYKAAIGKFETTNIVVEGETVVGLGYVPDEAEDSITQIDIKGCHVIPNITDVGANLGIAGQPFSESFQTEILAAQHGGITRLIPSPYVGEGLWNIQQIAEFMRTKSTVHPMEFFPMATISKPGHNQMVEIGRLKAEGVVGFCYDKTSLGDDVLKQVIRYSNSVPSPIVCHPVREDQAEGVMNEGEWSTILGLHGIPKSKEVAEVAKLTQLVAENGGQLVLMGLSAAASIEWIRQARLRGVPVSAGVSIHHLIFTDEDLDGYSPTLKVLPPFRLKSDQDALIEGLKDGTISFIYSQHAPALPEEKRQDIVAAKHGISSFDYYVPLVVGRLLKCGFDMDSIAPLISANPSQIFGVSHSDLAVGSTANFTVINTQKSSKVTADSFKSIGDNSPYLGKTLDASIEYTVVAGSAVKTK